MEQELDDVGEISMSSNRVYWTIKDFLKLPQKDGTVIASPSFCFAYAKWLFYLYPTRYRIPGLEGCLEVDLYKWAGSFSPFRVRIGIIGASGHEIKSCDAKCCGNLSFRAQELMSRPLFMCSPEMLPGGTLLVFCEIRSCGDATEGEQSVQEKAELDAKKSDKVERDQNACVQACTQTEIELDIGNLQLDFEELLLSGNSSDLTLKVKGKEFKAHRSILAARSPVFWAMMEHEMTEKATGIVDIEDSDPATFPDFLHYLYTGSRKNLTSENVLDLYTAADKYQVGELKRVCTQHMVNNISLENFCDVLSLSLRHHERKLTDVASQFFLQHSLEIILTAKWQTFLSKNPVAGNELFIKVLQAKKQ